MDVSGPVGGYAERGGVLIRGVTVETKQTIGCELPGLEGVQVTYDLMASEEQVNAWQQSLGSVNDGVVAEVTGWPEGRGEPFGPQAPLAFRIWTVQGGYQEAVRRFAADPLLSMRSRRFMPPISTDGS
jgi:hypothetical protein